MQEPLDGIPIRPVPPPEPTHPACGRRASARWRILSLLSGMALTVPLILISSAIGRPAGDDAYSGLTPRQIIEQVRSEIVPQDDASTAYGVRFNAEGYRTLLAWHSRYRVSRGRARSFEALDVTLPCCAFGQPAADEERNCACGHHQALYGLAKRLLGTGRSEQTTQVEIDRWAAYFFPRETLGAALAERAGSDSAFEEALAEFRQKGGC